MHPPAQPSTFELIARALVDSDFLSELIPGCTRDNLSKFARIAADEAAEAWEVDVKAPVGLTVAAAIRDAVTDMLIRHGSKVLAKVEDHGANVLRDAIDEGVLTVGREY